MFKGSPPKVKIYQDKSHLDGFLKFMEDVDQEINQHYIMSSKRKRNQDIEDSYD